MAYSGKLLQCVRGDWMETMNNSVITITVQGDTSIRNADTNALLVDIPKDAVDTWNIIPSAGVIIPQYNLNCIAFKFLDNTHFESFVEAAKICGIQFASGADITANSAIYDVSLPDVTDAAVQEYVLMLLLDDSFPTFVHQVQHLLGRIRDKVDTNTEM